MASTRSASDRAAAAAGRAGTGGNASLLALSSQSERCVGHATLLGGMWLAVPERGKKTVAGRSTLRFSPSLGSARLMVFARLRLAARNLRLAARRADFVGLLAFSGLPS